MKKQLLNTLALATLAASSLSTVQALEAGDWLVRVGAAAVNPAEYSGNANVALEPALKVEADDNTQLGITATYMFGEHLALGILAATPFNHTVTADLRGLAGVESMVETADITHLPPTLTVQYHFNPEGQLKPYLGFGINYTVFFDEEATAGFEAAAGTTDVDLDDSVGMAFEAGLDIQINDRWYANLAVWAIDIETKATLNTANLGEVVVDDININPIVLMIGGGYKF